MGRKLEILEEYEIPTEDIQNHLSILLLGEEEELKSVLGRLKNHNFSPSAIGKCLGMIGEKDEDLDQQEDLFQLLQQDYSLQQETIEKNWMGIRQKSKQELEDLLQVLHNHKIAEEKYAECLASLAQIDGQKWEKLFQALEESDLDETNIGDCLKFLMG